MTSTWPAGTLPERWIDEGERRDWTTVFAVLFVLVAGFVSSAWPFVAMLLTTMGPDSCGQVSCEGGITGATVGLAAGLLAEVCLLVATVSLSRRRQRVTRWACALTAPAMPWLGFTGVVIAG